MLSPVWSVYSLAGKPSVSGHQLAFSDGDTDSASLLSYFLGTRGVPMAR